MVSVLPQILESQVRDVVTTAIKNLKHTYEDAFNSKIFTLNSQIAKTNNPQLKMMMKAMMKTDYALWSTQQVHKFEGAKGNYARQAVADQLHGPMQPGINVGAIITEIAKTITLAPPKLATGVAALGTASPKPSGYVTALSVVTTVCSICSVIMLVMLLRRQSQILPNK